MRSLQCVLAASFIFLTCGCATSPKQLDLARDAFAAGDLTAARETLSELAQSRNRLSHAASL
ncbi:MAG: hypothetical protein HKN47_07715, partial [Pirellulaceae bacterium]|nr:hypothetical protein [Pirellulaceae bacterium]